MAGNAHLDPVWLWKWPEGLSEVLATCHSAIQRIQETPDFVFTRSSAVVYEWIEEVDPALFAGIKKYVNKGNWNIVGGWWVQSDVNLPSGESFVRQCLYGKKYFREKFGIHVKTAYNVDSFGHNASLPQILKKAGFENYLFLRPDLNEKKIDVPLFWWESADGSRILTCRTCHYGHWYNSNVDENTVRRVIENIPSGQNIGLHLYGVGDHGGGPTKEHIAAIIELNKRKDMPNMKFSSPQAFFDAVRKSGVRFPVLKDELQHHASGCYAAGAKIKEYNRQCENALITAEKFSSILCMLNNDFKYPKEQLDTAWKRLLLLGRPKSSTETFFRAA